MRFEENLITDEVAERMKHEIDERAKPFDSRVTSSVQIDDSELGIFNLPL